MLISGIDLLDHGAGGLVPDKLYLVRGGSGVGKTLLGLQYLTRGLELQDPGILITDQKPENVIAQAHAIGFAIEESVRGGQLAILNPSHRYFQLVESPADVMAIVDELFDYIKRIGARRLVIDPVYTLINTSYSLHFALSITQSLLNALEDLPVTTLLIAGDEQAPELVPIVRQLEQNAFGVIDLSHDASTGGRLMRLSKLRYANNESLSAHYRILNGRGLINDRGEGERGRRLNFHDRGITGAAEEITSLMTSSGSVMQTSGDEVSFDPEFNDRLQRNVETASKFDKPFALYWLKAEEEDADLNRALAQLCRHEDIVCHNRAGEFVAILTGTDRDGVKGFETRLHEKLGPRFQSNRHGYKLYNM